MQEKLLHFIWQNLLFDTNNLVSTDNEPIQINQKGIINTHAGPDFTNAKIKIGKTLWAGNIEIHIKSGDWKVHGHTMDAAYDNTILHVCWESDLPIYRTDGSKISCLILKDRVDKTLLHKYRYLMESGNDIPCSSMLHCIDEFTWVLWQERLVIERLEQKTEPIYKELEKTKYEWQEVFYKSIARTFGLKINTQPFENLANNLSLKILSKHKDSLKQIEALVFGVAGFLNGNLKDEYSRDLKKEYQFLKNKYQLAEVEKSNWKFLRLMPANFPTVRLAQFAALIHQSHNLFSKIIEENDLQKITNLLKTRPSPYWDTHYLLNELSSKRLKKMGNSAIQNIIINTIVPFKFAYGKHKDDETMQQNAFDLLEKSQAESNSIIKKWTDLGIQSKNSFQTQALLQLKNEYCNKKLCLNCSIGFKLLKNATA
ncbi:MAG: DUF2851 family protein [Bacteroidia bacterium]